MTTTRKSALRLCAPLVVLAGGALLSAQQLLPSTPPKTFGAGVTPAYEGWFDNPDGSHTFLAGYYSRNTQAAVDVPIGPNNHFEPGNPDMGQPTHFMPSRRYGMFSFTLPKEFKADQKIYWVLTVAGVTTKIPMYMSTDYNITPTKSSEEDSQGRYNSPPVLKFDMAGTMTFQAPLATIQKTVSRTATAGMPMKLDVWADDDALSSSGTNAPMRNPPPPVTMLFSKYRGAGKVTFDHAEPKLEVTKGGKPEEPFSGKATTNVTFSEPGDYMLHVTANDYSGDGGGGTVCCWTTAIVKVNVKGGPMATTGQ